MVSTSALAIDATKIDKGAKSPYQGVLMDEYDFRYLVSLEHLYEQNKMLHEAELIECNLKLTKCAQPEYWYESPFVWLFVGVIAGVSLK